jgi:alpha-L-fucosidase
MDWHDPDWAICKTDAAARRRFLDRVQAELRLLMTRYGKIDVLWYDGAYPFDAEGWESQKMNAMVFELQPDILINNRSWMAGDFSTPEQTITAAKGDWESCMTLNDHWGYGAADNNWKQAGTVIENLLQCAQGGGNYLLNIGPRADGSVPEPSVRILKEVGAWLRANGDSLRDVKKSQIERGDWVFFSQRDNTLFLYMRFWPGNRLVIGGIDKKPRRATLLATGREIDVHVRGTQLIFELPSERPDGPLPVIAAEFDSIPRQNSMGSRIIDDFIKLIQEEGSKGWT